MRNPRTLALVMAGGAGSRLDVLTEERAKPAMPYAGIYKLIDFPLSNCMHSGIDDVWIIQQYQPHSLTDYVANGRPWDLDRTYGGLRTLHPHVGDEAGGFHQGNADAIWRNKGLIAEEGPDVLLVLSADHVYKLDYSDVVRHHVERGAAVTMVSTTVGNDDPSRFGVVEVEDGKISKYDYKPDNPTSDIVTTEVFAFDTATLLTTLEELAQESGNGDDDSGLEDLGDDLLPRMVKEEKAYDFRLDTYWRDLGTIDSYWRAHMDLLIDDPQIDLDEPSWPIHTVSAQRPPAHVYRHATNENTMLSPGCKVHGRVVNSVLGPGVVVEQDATVRDSVVIDGALIGKGVVVESAIVDEKAHIEEGAVVGRHAGKNPSADEVTVVGRAATVRRGVRVTGGERVPPHATAG